MNDNDVYIIFDYWLTEPKKKKLKFGEYLKDFFKKTDTIMIDEYKDIFAGDFLNAYAKLKDSLKNISNEDKMGVIMAYIGKTDILVKINNNIELNEYNK